MNPVIGFGGIRMDMMIDGEPISVVIPKRIAYSGQPSIKPVGWEAVTVNDKQLQVIDGYHLSFEVTFENVTDGDEELIRSVAMIINHSYRTGYPFTFYPKYRANSLTNRSWDVLPESDWEPLDLNKKRRVAQRISLVFSTMSPVEEI